MSQPPRPTDDVSERLAHIGASVPGVICSYHLAPDGRVSMPFATPAVEDLYGLPASALALDFGLALERIHPADRPRVMARLVEVSRSPSRWHDSYRYVHPTKGTVWIEGWSMPEVLPDGTIAWHGFVMDVTDRKRDEEALRESEERYRQLVDNLDDVVFSVDIEGRVTFVSGVVARFGFKPDEVIGRPFESFAHPDDREGVRARLTEHLAGRVEPYEWRLLDRAGKTRYVRSASRTIRVDGEIRGTRGVLLDLTAQRETEEQLRQAQKMEAIGRLAGGVAHDFNNMLSVILSSVDFVLDATPPDDPTRPDLLEIRIAGERAAALTRQLLAFSRKQVLQPTVLDLDALVGGMQKMLGRLIGEDVDLVVVPTPGLGKTKADPSHVEQAIMNLAINARDAMPHGGTLTIETANVLLDDDYAHSHVGARPGAYVMLAVSDTGCGMDEATMGQVFDPFFTTKESGRGTGLGLAMVYGFVKQTGGHIWVYSEVGHGSVFKIYLPMEADSEEANATLHRAPARAQGKETVLVVEDVPVVLTLARRVLEAAGFTVLAAANASEALAVAETCGADLDLLLTDVVMPGMNGRELASRLVEHFPRLRVLYMSGYTENAIAHHGVFEGGIQLLSKPFDSATLTHAVRHALD